jgi:sulfur carrier protein
MGVILVSGKELQAKDGSTIESAISENGLHPDSYLYLVDGRPVPMDTVVSEGMTVKAMRVASGG